jgi:hypothetical protein
MGQELRGLPYPKDFTKSKDSNGYITTVGADGHPGNDHRTDERDRHGRLLGYVLGVDPGKRQREVARRT